eukprot:249776-Prymnesium_polylepis.1
MREPRQRYSVRVYTSVKPRRSSSASVAALPPATAHARGLGAGRRPRCANVARKGLLFAFEPSNGDGTAQRTANVARPWGSDAGGGLNPRGCMGLGVGRRQRENRAEAECGQRPLSEASCSRATAQRRRRAAVRLRTEKVSKRAEQPSLAGEGVERVVTLFPLRAAARREGRGAGALGCFARTGGEALRAVAERRGSGGEEKVWVACVASGFGLPAG